jgi:PAS domain S-box-containing protein
MILRPSVAAYAVSLGAVAVAIAARLLLDPVLGDRLPFTTVFCAVVFVAWYGGRWPALVALITGGVAVAYFVLEPRHNLAIEHSQYRAGIALYGVLGLATIGLLESIRNAWQRAAEQSELLKTTLASIGDAVITTDAAGRITRMNAVAESLTGWSIEEAGGKPLDTVLHLVNAETREPAENPVARALREGALVGLANHTLLIARDGTERFIDDSAAPIRRNEREVVGCALVFRDVTDKRLHAQELEYRERQFRTLAESIPQLAWMANPDGHIFWYNRRWYDYTGTTFEEMEGWGWQSVHHPDELPGLLTKWKAAIASGEPLDTVFPLKGKDGVFRPFLTRVVPVKDSDGRVARWFGTNTDISELKRTEESLRQRVEEIRTLLDTLPIGIFIAHDPECRRVTGNAAAHQLLRTSSENLSKSASPEEQPAHFRVCRDGVEIPANQLPVQRAARGEHIRNEEVDEVFDDGTVLHALISAAPLYDARGRVRGSIASVLDVTDRKRAEESLREADRRKDEFLAILAHELRNPLAPIMSSLELMKRARGDADMIERARATIERQIVQMVRLVDDLLDVSRITRNQLKLKLGRVELASVVHHALEACRPDYESAGHELNVALPPDPIYLQADPVRLAQVLSNLLSNACKYTKPGGRISLTVSPQDREIAVAITDTGVGISAEMLPKVFDMFTQIDRSLERSEGGLGIGLSLVKRFVDLHGGSVTARSDGPGRGSEFVVRLPILAEQPESPPQPDEDSEESSPTPAFRRILVVDDTRDSADSLAMLLSYTGKEVQTAYDGVEAVEKAAALRPDVILLDIGLPKISGYAACRAIRAQPWGQDIIIIAVTGWGQEEDRRKSQEAGFDGHLVKPVDHDALTKLLGSLSRRAAPRYDSAAASSLTQTSAFGGS